MSNRKYKTLVLLLTHMDNYCPLDHNAAIGHTSFLRSKELREKGYLREQVSPHVYFSK